MKSMRKVIIPTRYYSIHKYTLYLLSIKSLKCTLARHNHNRTEIKRKRVSQSLILKQRVVPRDSVYFVNIFSEYNMYRRNSNVSAIRRGFFFPHSCVPLLLHEGNVRGKYPFSGVLIVITKYRKHISIKFPSHCLLSYRTTHIYLSIEI